ncbi:hypothetical protein Taro_051246 [Colocasia esculenta]|uniref:Exostosin GT47 domain-containing protein n=1 Tax=Colocasia esculenta TaxID=4460 RepID=A0A843XGA9_COLES|nr:hypothetical protein [Colocasia esculenta]
MSTLSSATRPGEACPGGAGRENCSTRPMALSLLRRRTLEPGDVAAAAKGSEAVPCHPQQKQSHPITTTFLVMCLLLIWFSSMLLSGSFFHVCFSSRKLQLYCISGGAGRDRGVIHAVESDYIATAAVAGSNISTYRAVVEGTVLSNKNSAARSYLEVAEGAAEERKVEVVDGRKEEIEQAVKAVEEKLRVIRSWAAPAGGGGRGKLQCEGRGVFVYDLPSKFNGDLMARCHGLLPWTDLCPHFADDGMGEAIPALGRGWHKTHQYALEPIFHQRVLRHPCRVHNPDHARLFYVPFYGGLDILRWHFKNVSTEVKDALAAELVRWLEQQSSWARNNGRDHMFVLGKISWDFRRRRDDSWGSNFLDLPQMQNPFKFLIERQPWLINDIGIPHPTYFHPQSDDDIAAWQAKIISSSRKHFASFAGASRPGDADSIRSVLIRQCMSGKGRCEFLDCNAAWGCSEPERIIGLFAESEFCMQPPGDSPTRKSVFDSLVAGCIPVLFDPFTAYYQYPWHLPEDHHLYSVYIGKEEVKEGKVDVVERLLAVPAEEREKMRRYIVYELMPRLVYGDATAQFNMFEDAFGVVMNNMMHVATRSDVQRAHI